MDEPGAEQGEPAEKQEKRNGDQIFRAGDGFFLVAGPQPVIDGHGEDAPEQEQEISGAPSRNKVKAGWSMKGWKGTVPE